MKKCIINFRKNFFGGKIVSDKSESLTKLEEDEKYNRLTALKLFAMTSSMVISVNELAPFGKTGPTDLTRLNMVCTNYANGRRNGFS